MTLQTPQQPPSPDQDVDAGVIDDARARQHRQRWIGTAVIAALVVAGVIIGFSGGGGGSGGNGASPGGPGAPLPSETVSLRAPKPSLLAHAIRHCDKQGIARSIGRIPGAKTAENPFANGLVLSGVTGSVVGLIAVSDGRELSCVYPMHPGGYYPGGGSQGPVELVPEKDKITGSGWGTMSAMLGSVSEGMGRAGRGVSSVEFVFADHRGVRARVENGWYLALWPHQASGALNSSAPTSAFVTTSSGTVSSPMPGARCNRDPNSCVFARSPLRAVPHRPDPSVTSPRSSLKGATGPTLQQLLANFAILRRHQTAADRSWKPPCDCGTTVQVRDLTRLATSLPDGYRVFLDVKRATSSGSQFSPGSYLLGLNLVSRSGNTSSVEFGSDTQYSIYPISTGRMASRGSPLYAPHGNQALASIVPDGVAAVRWTITVRCPKLASSHGVHCPTISSKTITVPVVNNIAARTLPGVDSDPFYANINNITWLGPDGRVITAFNGYGNLAAPPFLAGHLNTGTRRILSGIGIADAHIGQPTSRAIQALTRLLGPAAYTNAATSGCGVDTQTVWESPTTADPLTVYSKAGHFVGYQYGAAPKLIGMRQGPGAVLTTHAGLTLSMPISAAKHLYPAHVATVSSPQLGRFNITGQTNPIYGYALPNRYPARTVSASDPIATIGAGNTGCPQTA
jgi:hypothetical protein